MLPKQNSLIVFGLGLAALLLMGALGVGAAALLLAGAAPVIVRAEGGPAAPVESSGVPVSEVTVEFGLGSPYPVNAVVGIDLPNSCAQVSAVRQTLAGREFQITVEAATFPGETCRADSLPYKLTLPLNMAGLEHGAYTVVVNGVRADDFSFPPAAGQ